MRNATPANTWMASQVADAYARHTATLRGALRHALVVRGLLAHLPTPRQRVLDVGGGDARHAIALAQAGHEVCVLDPDEQMLARARENLTTQPAHVAQRVHLVRGQGEHACDLVGGGFDAALCHGVLMYVGDCAPMLRTLVEVTRPGGLVSVLAKQAPALAMRPALEGRWADALQVLDESSETGRLGVTSHADSLEQVAAVLEHAGARTVQWRGVRVFTDHMGDAGVDGDFETIVELEWQAGARDPYRGVARLFHLISQVHKESQ